MPSSYLEIVELADGEIVLQQSDKEDAEPLVVIRFSEESRAFMTDACLDVAKVMIQAGIQAASQYAEQAEVDEDQVDSEGQRVIH
ncbi:MAG: hypothetical protein ACI9GW_000614 [Halieaceae bacterium]